MFSAIDPVSTSIVGHSLELEWEDTLFANRWTRNCGTSRLQRRLGVDTGNCCGGGGSCSVVVVVVVVVEVVVVELELELPVVVV